MPFVSKAQQRWGNSPAGIKALGGKAAVAHWNAETRGQGLPEKKTLSALKKYIPKVPGGSK